MKTHAPHPIYRSIMGVYFLTMLWCLIVVPVRAEAGATSTVSDEAVERMIEYVSKEVAEERARREGTIDADEEASVEAERALQVEAPAYESQTVSAASVQGTAFVQEGVESLDLQSTANPQKIARRGIASDRVKLVPHSAEHVAKKTSFALRGANTVQKVAVIPGPASLEVVREAIDALVPIDEASDEVADTEEVPVVAIEAISLVEDLDIAFKKVVSASAADFQFELTGRQIPTKHAPRDRRLLKAYEEGIPIVDNEKGAITISGACSDVYYVVLLFKKATDYTKDPTSHVVNKAYLCIGGEYSYALSKLPVGLQAGTYYLLVGEQGSEGTWRPITDLTEVIIRNNH